MKTPDNAIFRHEATIDIAVSPEAVYDLVADISRIGEWSPETVGAEWLDSGSGKQGDWFRGHNVLGEDNKWSRDCQMACADRGHDFTFAVGGVEANCTWWSYEMEAIDSGTRLTERWWVVNLTDGFAAYTAEQKQQRADRTAIMLKTTIAAIKETAESAAP